MITKISSMWISMCYWPIHMTVHKGFVQNLRFAYSLCMFMWAKYICSFSLLFMLEEGTFLYMVTAVPVDMENYTSISSES
jgi:hypothetical protein